MFNKRCYESEVKMSDGIIDTLECAPIMETPCERVINREICHNVEHIQPINTRIINHHIYHHTYKPCYTCTEENEVCDIYDQNPCCH